MKHIVILSFLVILACQSPLFGQKVTYQLTHYSVEDGLPSHWVLSLLEHSSGFLWAGTTMGLCRFDGYAFTTIEGPDEYAEAFKGSVQGMYEADSGMIHMNLSPPSLRSGTTIFVRYDPGNDIVKVIEESTFKSFSERASKGEFGNFRGMGTPTVEGEITSHKQEDIYQNRLITTSINSKPLTATLILATGEQLDLTKEWKTLIKASAATSKNLGNNIYWTSYNGLIKISIRRSPFDLILAEEAEVWEYRTICRALCEINEDSILIATEKQGEAVYDRSTKNISYVNWSSPMNNDFRPFRNLSGPGPNGEVYGARATEVFKLTPSSQENSRIARLGSISLTSASFGPSSYLTAGAIGAEYKYYFEIVDLAKGTTRKFEVESAPDLILNSRATYILPVSDSTIWYCTKSGLFLLDIVHGEIEHLYLDKDAEVKSYDFPVSYNLSGPHVWVVHDSGDGNLWIGMDGNGLNVVNLETGDTEFFTTADGLPNNTVVGILPDSSGYWISTFNGLSHYDTANNEFRNFYQSNGISHNEFNRFSFMIDHYGKYYFGSMNGITSFFPDEVLDRPEELKILVSEIAHYDKKGNARIIKTEAEFESKPIIIPSNNRLLSIKICLNDFNNPTGSSFFYRLKEVGFTDRSNDQNWTALGMRNELRFENLEAGKYQLHLKGVSSIGVASDERVLSVVVNDFFYRTWWFILGGILLTFTILFGLHRSRLKQALRIERLRTRLSSDLHDDVGGLLSGVALQMEVLEHTVEEKHRNQIQRVAKSSRRAMEKMRDVVWAIDARQQSLEDLKSRMLEFAEEVLAPLDLTYIIDIGVVPAKTRLPSDMRHNLLLIFKEFAANSAKYADATRLEVRFNKTGKKLKMQVSDNGIGFDVNAASGTGQGLRNMQMRAEHMHGTIQFLNGKGFGIAVIVPLA